MDLYRENILDHYKHPRHYGTLDHPDSSVVSSNASCGDTIRIDVMIERASNGTSTVGDIKFSGVGCAISQASASMLCEKAKGMQVGWVILLTKEDVFAMLGTELTPSRIKCALLPLEVLQKAVLGMGD